MMKIWYKILMRATEFKAIIMDPDEFGLFDDLVSLVWKSSFRGINWVTLILNNLQW